MRLRINTEGATFICARTPEARTDRETGIPRTDRESGLPLWQVQVAAFDSSGVEAFAITVAGQPTVAVGSQLALEDLVAIPWSQGDRSGVAFRAASMKSLGGPIPGMTPASDHASPSSAPSQKPSA